MTILQNARQDLVKGTFILNALGTYIHTDRKCYTVVYQIKCTINRHIRSLNRVPFDTRESTGGYAL